jgi:ribonucleoside-diphosphate reductase alpha chain
MKGLKGFEKILKFTEDFRALGLGALGFHSLLQSKNIAFESLEAQFLNIEIFKKINEEATKASKFLAEKKGESMWCKGTGMRNATLIAVAPNTSSALLCGGVSQGIEPIVANTFNQNTSAGEFTRMGPYLVNLLKKKGLFSVEFMRDIDVNHNGSVQHLDCLSKEEKDLFKTAFEINQRVLIRYASQRQKYIDQAQSLNLFFESDEEYIAEVIKEAVLDPWVKSLYYQRSLKSIRSSTGECVACEG